MHWEARAVLDKRERQALGELREPVRVAAGGAWPALGVAAVLDELRDAVVATDQAGLIRYANAAAEELLGWPHGSLTGRSVFEIVPESVPKRSRTASSTSSARRLRACWGGVCPR